MSLVKKFATVGSGTMLSRIFGFAREMMMAAALGTGPVAEAFYAAFQFPNTFRRLFAEGAFNAAFVPLFAREIEAGGVAGAKKFSEEVFGVLFSVLLLLTIAMELAMPLVIRYAIAPGFAEDPAKLLLTTELAAIMFPYLICMSLGAMMAGMLNSLHRYFAAAIAPVFLNIILVAILSPPGTAASTDGGRLALGWGVLAAVMVQLGIVFLAVRRAGVSIGFRRPRLTPNVKRLLWLALPAAITGGITQINTLVGTAIASGQAGAVPALNLADRVYQLPLGVVGVAVGVVLLPELARALRSGHLVDAGNLQNRSVEFTLFLTLPAAAALLTMSEPIVRVLYEATPSRRRIRRWSPVAPSSARRRLRAHQGLHAGLFRTRGHADADDLRGDLGGGEHIDGAMAVPVDGSTGDSHRRGGGRLGQRLHAARRADCARPLEERCRPAEAHAPARPRLRADGCRHPSRRVLAGAE